MEEQINDKNNWRIRFSETISLYEIIIKSEVPVDTYKSVDKISMQKKASSRIEICEVERQLGISKYISY